MYSLRTFILVTWALLSLSGCGPIVGGVQILNADSALSAARSAGAEQAALYEYTAAQLYLQKAREEHGYSNYWAARMYAERAQELAQKARQRAAAAQAEQPETHTVTVPGATP